MFFKLVVLILGLAVFFFTPVNARGDDIDDLKAFYDKCVEAYNKADIDGFMACWQDKMIAFRPNVNIPTEDKAIWRKQVQEVFGLNESVTFSLINPQFRVLGNIGLIWGDYRHVLKPKNLPTEQVSQGRVMFIYTKSNGRWLVQIQHLIHQE